MLQYISDAIPGLLLSYLDNIVVLLRDKYTSHRKTLQNGRYIEVAGNSNLAILDADIDLFCEVRVVVVLRDAKGGREDARCTHTDS